MSQTVEEILTAAQQLPDKERKRLSELLKRDQAAGNQSSRTHAPALETSQSRTSNQIPASRDAEMQWLLDHPDFWDQHRGEYVALWGYEMIGVGKNGKEVLTEAHRRGIKFPFVQYLPKDENEWLLGMSNQPVFEP